MREFDTPYINHQGQTGGTAVCLYRIFILVSLVAALFAATAKAQETPYTQRENIVYGEAHGVALVMDVFTPHGDKNGLGIVDVISGAWHSDRGKIRDRTRAQTLHEEVQVVADWFDKQLATR